MPYKKPKRRCLFCGLMQSQLSRHIRLKHGDEVTIAESLKLTRVQRIQQFKIFKRKGISDHNKIEARKEKPSYQRESKARKNFGLTKCSHCGGFVSRRYFAKHKHQCQLATSEPVVSLLVELDEMSATVKVSESFKRKILAKLRADKIGKYCLKDDPILLIGKKIYQKHFGKEDKQVELHRTVKGHI